MSERDFGNTGGTSGRSATTAQDWLTEPAEYPSSNGGDASATQQAQSAASAVQEKAGQAVETAKEKVDQVADQAATKVDAGMDKAAGGLESLAETIRDKGPSDGQGGVGSAVAMTADKLESAATYLRDKDTDQLMNELEGLVRRKPVESMVAAAAVGFVLSKVLR